MSELLITTPPSWEAANLPAGRADPSGRLPAPAVAAQRSAGVRHDEAAAEHGGTSFPALLLGFQPPVTSPAAIDPSTGIAAEEAHGAPTSSMSQGADRRVLVPLPFTDPAVPADAGETLADGMPLPATGNSLPPHIAAGAIVAGAVAGESVAGGPVAGGTAMGTAGNAAAGLSPVPAPAPDDGAMPAGNALPDRQAADIPQDAGTRDGAERPADSLADLEFVRSGRPAITRSAAEVFGSGDTSLHLEGFTDSDDRTAGVMEPAKSADAVSTARDLFTALWRGGDARTAANFATANSATADETLLTDTSGTGHPTRSFDNIGMTGAGHPARSFVLAPLGDAARWSDGLGDRMLMLAGEGSHSARLKLYPEHLGALDVRLRVEDGNAQLWFSSSHAQVRDALESALPRLREMFAEQGLALVHTEVNSGNPGERDAPDRDDTRNEGFGRTGTAMESPAASLLAAIRAPAMATDRLVDLWA